MNSTRALTSLQKENSRGTQGGLEGCGSEQSAGDPRYRCATLISNWENPHAPKPGHENPGESNDTPQASGEAKAKWRTRTSTSVHSGMAGVNRYNIIIIKQEIRGKIDYQQD